MIADRYEVVRVLGEGSSGRTMLCTDGQTGDLVAVKQLLFQHMSDWKHMELFEREANMLARLDHPGIPRILDFFRDPGESTTLYLVQEFMDGASLRERMDSGPMLGQDELHALTLEILDVLDYLHGRAPPVLHRDIKPSNILIRDEGGAALVDFGGVCLGWRPPGEAGATVVGTFGYMPPEQLLDQSMPASDLYALGATLLHVVTGRAPSEFPFDSGRIEVPSDLPAGPALSRLIEALLRPAPRDRPSSAAAARRILTEPVEEPGSANTTSPDAGTDVPARRTAREVRVASETGPRFVALRPEPRDQDGEFRDVRRNLINPLFPARRLWGGGMHAFWVTLAGFLSVATVGLAPLGYLSTVRNRKRRFAELFERGRFTEGRIRSVEDGALYATFEYEFEVEGVTYIASMSYAQEMADHWGEGDVVPVLYDPDDPTQCCFVYR